MGPILKVFLSTTGTLAACATLPGTVELLALTCGSFLPGGRRQSTVVTETWNVAVVVPAHNEAANIASCIQSLLRSSHGSTSVDVYVIADNCTDETAQIAQAAGAKVLIRNSESERGKGYALHFAFSSLAVLNYDCYLVVDADTQVADNFVSAASERMRQGSPSIQARYLVSNLDGGVRVRLMGLALRAFNVVRPLGRERLGLSVGILGNGFGLRRETLDEVPYLASSVVEDLEYHLALIQSGKSVSFVNETTVFGEMPVRGKGVKTQRSRWEGGRLRMLVEKSPALLRQVLKGRFLFIEPLLELLLLPLAFHVTLLCFALLTPIAFVKIVSLIGIGVVALHLLAAIVVGGGSWQDAGTLAIAPFYILWKLIMIPAVLRSARSGNEWIRTKRNAEETPEDASR